MNRDRRILISEVMFKQVFYIKVMLFKKKKLLYQMFYMNNFFSLYIFNKIELQYILLVHVFGVFQKSSFFNRYDQFMN